MDTKDFHFIKINEVANGMVTNMEVFDMSVPSLIFGKLTDSLIVAVDGHGIEDGHIEAIKKLAEEKELVRSLMHGDVFRIARGTSSVFLFA